MSKEAMKLALEALEKGKYYAKTLMMSQEPFDAAIKALAEQPAQQEPMAWPAGLIERITAAEQRIQDGHAPRRIPADPTDVDLVLAEVRYLLEGKQPPFWVSTSPPAQRTWVGLTDEEVRKVNQEVWGYVSADHARMRGYAQAIEAKLKEKNT